MHIFVLFLFVAAASAQKEISCSDLADMIAQNSNDIKQLTKCQNFRQWNDVERSNLVNATTTNRAFFIGTEKLNWDAADEWCKRRSMSLASLKMFYDLTAVVVTLLESHAHLDQSFWLSASDKGRTRGDFVWSDGTPVDTISWDRDYPKAFKEDERETGVLFHFGSLHDQKWYNENMFLCEVPPELEKCL